MEPLVRLLKRTGIGALYIVGSPLIAIGFVFFATYGLFVFVFVSLQSIYLFFSGQVIFTPLPEDQKAKLRYENLLKQNPPSHKASPQEPQ
jgi:hypothetical protein